MGKAKHHAIKLPSGLKMHVWEWPAKEPVDDARTLLCVHGLLRLGEDFAKFADQHPEYRILAPDVRGRGRSEWASPESYNLTQYVKDMEFIFTHFGLQRVNWVGTSMGGLIGMLFAAKHPGMVRRLILNDVGPYVPLKAMRRISDYAGKFPVFETKDDARKVLAKYYKPFNLAEKDFNALVDYSIREMDDGYTLHFDPGLSKTLRKKPKLPAWLWPVYKRIKCPVMVIRGETSDVLLEKTVKKMRRKSKHGFRALEVPDVGHAPMLWDAETNKAIAAFIEMSAQDFQN